MPKVSDTYKIEKKKNIVDATTHLLKTLPLYKISMTDIIKQAGLSKGGLYLYYHELDDILIDAINTLTNETSTISFSIPLDEEDVIYQIRHLFQKMACYLKNCPSFVQKVRSELMIYLANNPKKSEYFMSRLKLKDDGKYFIDTLSQLIQKGITEKIFREDISLDSLLTNTGVYLDGIGQTITYINSYTENEPISRIDTLLAQYAELLLAYIIRK